jgi:YD repeat-containing protein
VTKPLLIACVLVLSSSAGCLRSVRPTPAEIRPAEPAVTANLPAPRQPHWPVHKGGVDLSTGVYTREDDDLFVNTTNPIVLRRTYQSADKYSRQFGVDTTHPGEWWLHGDGDPRVPWGDLILANGGRIHFTRISPGETKEGAVLRHDSTPTEFNGALLIWTGSRWEMRFRDGSLAVFLSCQGPQDHCSVVERSDAGGHRIAYVRDEGGRLLRMESEGQSIAFDYDDHKRIVRAYDTSQHIVWYSYDDRGRLIRATDSDGTMRDYAYDESDHLTSVREPGRILKNWFDESGRWVRQEVRSAETDNDPYVATVRYTTEAGAIVQTDFDEGYGVERVRYNKHHYIVSDVINADRPNAVTFTYDRDETTNIVGGVTLACTAVSGPVTRTVPMAVEQDDDAKLVAIREACVPGR